MKNALLISLVVIFVADIEFFRPGCTGSVVTFLELFWYTILLFVCTGIMFFGMCLVRRALRIKLEAKSAALEKKASLDRMRTRTMLRQQSLEQQKPEEEIVQELQKEEERLEEEKRKAALVATSVAVPPNVDFRHRVIHSLLILLAIYYLKITTLCIRGVECSMQPDPVSLVSGEPATTSSLYLNIDSGTRCYTDAHAATVAFIFLCFVFYSCGFPVFCFVIIMRAFITPQSGGVLGWLSSRSAFLRSHRPETSALHARILNRQLSATERPPQAKLGVWDVDTSAEEAAVAAKKAVIEKTLMQYAVLSRARQDMMGYLFLGLKDSCPTWRVLTTFPAQMTFAIANNVTSSTIVQLFILGLVSVCSMMSVISAAPFQQGFKNVQMGVAFSATLAHCCLMMLSSDTTIAAQSPYFLILMAFWVRRITHSPAPCEY